MYIAGIQKKTFSFNKENLVSMGYQDLETRFYLSTLALWKKEELI